MSGHQLSALDSQLICWHGLRFAVPDTWNPVKVDGDRDQGYMLLADLQAAKLGVRWKRMKRGEPTTDAPHAIANRALRDEVGRLAAGEAVDYAMREPADWRVSRLYTDAEPPGRDIWVGWSRSSNRLVEIVHHVSRRDRVLADNILPSVSDTNADEPHDWAIFDLSCRSPAGWHLQWYRLNAGDLSLAFRKQRQTVIIRQIGPAKLALARQPLKGWMAQQDKTIRKFYRPLPEPADVTMEFSARTLSGKRAPLIRKRRFFWAWMMPHDLTVIALHDEPRNRILLAQGNNETVMKELLESVGWVKNVE